MKINEYYAAKTNLSGQRKRLVDVSRKTRAYQRELYKYLNLLITVKGHAWCMDVISERDKMARLMAKAIKELPAL